MNKLSTVFCAFALAIISLGSCSPEEPDTKPVVVKPDDKKDDNPTDSPTTPTIKSVKLTLVTSGIHGATLTKVEDYSYKIARTAADPYVFSSSIQSDLGTDYQVLEFEYKCSGSIGDLQIFYALKGAPAENSSQKYSDLKTTSSYVKYSVLINKFRNNGWGKKGDCLRLDPGDNAGEDFYIRNLVIREMTDEEKKTIEDQNNAEQAKTNMAKNLESYLSKTYPSSVTKVTVTADKVTVEGKVGGSGTYKLADITPWQDVTEMTSFPYVEAISGSDFSITLDRVVKGREEIDYDRVFSKWAIIKVDGDTQTLDSHARYADEVAAKSSPEEIKLKNKKGFGAGDIDLYFSDCKEMNVGSITMNVTLNNMLTGEGYQYSYGGKVYNIGSGKDYVDRIVGKAGEMGIVVSAIILCPSNSIFRDPECEGGYYSMPNITTAKDFNQYAAALEYMASRYCHETPGRIAHWIMHNEVDMGSEWTNMGSQPMMRYLDRYVKSMRICYNIVRQYDQNASILGSYTHNWTQADGGYAPKEMLEKTVAYSNAEGDFWWGLAYHPYPQDLTRPSFWDNDGQSTYNLDSKYVTFKNLEVVDHWIKMKANLYKGEKKRILFLSENGTNSPSYSESDLRLQAAGGAWAWKKTNALDGIDAIQWHNWADNSAEFGLRIGLRSFAAEGLSSLSPKPVWYVWKAGGTDQESEVFDPYMSTLGISSWDSIMHPF